MAAAEAPLPKLCIEALKDFPDGALAKDIALKINKKINNVSATLGSLFYKGIADRKNVGGKTSPSFHYSLNEKQKPPRVKPARKSAAEKKKPVEPVKPLPTKKAAIDRKVSKAKERLQVPAAPINGGLPRLFDALAEMIADELFGRVIASLESKLTDKVLKRK